MCCATLFGDCDGWIIRQCCTEIRLSVDNNHFFSVKTNHNIRRSIYKTRHRAKFAPVGIIPTGSGTFKLSQTVISIRFHFGFRLFSLAAYSAKKILIEIRKISLSKSYFPSLTSRPIYFQSIDDFGILELKN